MDTWASRFSAGLLLQLSLLLVIGSGFGSCAGPLAPGPTGREPGSHIGLVYYSERDGRDNIGALYVRDVYSGEERRLTEQTELVALDNGYDWSPTAGRFVYVAGVGARAEIYTMDITGQAKLRLTNNDVAEVSPTWSPDGARIAFVRREGLLEVSRTYIMNADGSDVYPLFADPDVASGSVAWAPNGRWLAVDVPHPRPGQPAASKVLILEVATGNEIAHVVDGMGHLLLAWSPDSTRLAYTAASYSHNGYSAWQLYVLVVATGESFQVASMNVAAAAWSPDSQRLVFTALNNASTSIYVAHHDGTEQVELPTRQPYNLNGPWSPDGREIVFIAAGTMQKSAFDIYTLNVDTQQINRITDNGFFEAVVRWITW